MLKAELHIHVQGDPVDDKQISYSPQKLIDSAAEQNFDVLAFTCHNKVVHTSELEDYARRKNILLIPGVERTIQGKHVLLYNLTEKESHQITSFSALAGLKQKKQSQNQPFLIIAPHPFHFSPRFSSLKKGVVRYLNLFDAWEYSHFYSRWFNPNKKTVRLARRYRKPLIGNSDVHYLDTLGKTYTLISAGNNLDSIFHAIKSSQTKIKTQPLPFFLFLRIALKIIFY